MTDDRPPITVGDIIELAKRAAPDALIVGGYRIRYIGDDIGEWTPYDADAETDDAS